MTHSVVIRHNFETAHRLPVLGGKCLNLHGHSWWGRITMSVPALEQDTVAEFGAFKRAIRTWIDTYLDHGTILGAEDPLVAPLRDAGCRVFRFGAADPTDAEKLVADLAWPTVENVAVLLSRVGADALVGLDTAPGAEITEVHVDETQVNSAVWTSAVVERGRKI